MHNQRLGGALIATSFQPNGGGRGSTNVVLSETRGERLFITFGALGRRHLGFAARFCSMRIWHPWDLPVGLAALGRLHHHGVARDASQPHRFLQGSLAAALERTHAQRLNVRLGPS